MTYQPMFQLKDDTSRLVALLEAYPSVTVWADAMRWVGWHEEVGPWSWLGAAPALVHA